MLRWSETKDLLGKGGRGEPGPQWLLCGAQEQCWRSGSPQGPRPATGGEEKVGGQPVRPFPEQVQGGTRTPSHPPLK